jgi:chromosome segregation ATPase
MTDDSNCHCQTCTTMNEPLTLEGDIRYLKAHIETKDRQLADAQLRINIYKEAWQDAEKYNVMLREDDKKNRARITELEDTVLRLQQANKPSLGGNLGLQAENDKLEADILDLEKQNEHLLAALNNVRNVLIRVSGEIEGLVQVD